MRTRHPIISLLLLFVFGVGMLENISSLHEESPNLKKSFSTSNCLTKMFQPENDHCPTCDDPCHLGQCHLGHCAHLILTAFKSNFLSPLVALTNLGKVATPPTPILAGLKRPPRLS